MPGTYQQHPSKFLRLGLQTDFVTLPDVLLDPLGESSSVSIVVLCF